MNTLITCISFLSLLVKNKGIIQVIRTMDVISKAKVDTVVGIAEFKIRINLPRSSLQADRVLYRRRTGETNGGDKRETTEGARETERENTESSDTFTPSTVQI